MKTKKIFLILTIIIIGILIPIIGCEDDSPGQPQEIVGVGGIYIKNHIEFEPPWYGPTNV